MSNPKKITRRKFMGHTAKGVVGLAGYSLLKSNLSRASNNKSLVVTVQNDDAAQIEIIEGRRQFNINQDVADRMVEAGIRGITGIEDIGEAWKRLFPGITRDKVISIKINSGNNGNLSNLTVNKEVIDSITNGLTKMQVDGQFFPAENIIVWDISDSVLIYAGFTINKGDTGIKCYGSTPDWISGAPQNIDGYSTAVLYDVHGVGQYISKILVDQTDYLINLSVLKHMRYSGVTLSLKNNYGCCHNPADMHDNYCNPYIPALNAVSPIRDKQVICIIDAIYGVISGGPFQPPQKTPNRLIFSTDTVAIDKVGRDLLKEKGMSPFIFDIAKHIETASQEPYILGNSDPEKIEEVFMDITAVEQKWSSESLAEDFRIFQNYPNPFNTQTTISYQLFKPSRVNINIFNVHGVLVRNLIDEYQTSGYYRIFWNGTNSNGNPVPSGTYFGRVLINDIQQTIRMSLVK